MKFFSRPLYSPLTIAGLRVLLGFAVGTLSANARPHRGPMLATSAEDAALRSQLLALSPNVKPDEARRVASIAYTTGRELAREWQVVWPPGLQNFLVNHGAKKGGLCFQWAAELLARLDRLRLQTLQLHWAESFATTSSEHNVIVVTARGQPFTRGILLDNWRYSGRLAWGPISDDPHYHWEENKPELEKRRIEANRSRRVIHLKDKGRLPIPTTKRAQPAQTSRP